MLFCRKKIEFRNETAIVRTCNNIFIYGHIEKLINIKYFLSQRNIIS